MNPLTFPNFDATLFVYTVILAFLLSLTALAVLSFIDHDRGQKLLRTCLGNRLASTRMFKMLERRHIAPLSYIQETGIADLRAQIRTCRNCSRQDMCDESLYDIGVRQPNFSFCPNRRTVEKLIRAAEIAQSSP